MAITDVKCPHCSGVMHVEGDMESIFCQYCGKKIDLRKTEEPKDTMEDLPGLKSLLTERSANGTGGQEVVSICDRILRLDPEYPDAWIQKGYASRDIQVKMDCIIKGMRNIGHEDYERYFEMLSKHLAGFVFYTDFEEWSPYEFSSLDIEFSEKKPDESEQDDFLLEVLSRLAERIINSIRPEDAVKGLSKYASLSIVAMSLYCDIKVQRDILDDIVKRINRMLAKCGHTVPEREFDDRTFKECCKLYAEFLGDITAEIRKRTGDILDEDLEGVVTFWSERGVSELTIPLYDTIDTLTDILGMGFIESIKAKRKYSATIEEYVDNYLNCVQPE